METAVDMSSPGFLDLESDSLLVARIITRHRPGELGNRTCSPQHPHSLASRLVSCQARAASRRDRRSQATISLLKNRTRASRVLSSC